MSGKADGHIRRSKAYQQQRKADGREAKNAARRLRQHTKRQEKKRRQQAKRPPREVHYSTRDDWQARVYLVIDGHYKYAWHTPFKWDRPAGAHRVAAAHIEKVARRLGLPTSLFLNFAASRRDQGYPEGAV